ncbi:pol protein [Cucumis melo var. makuwa]|uniref:Pol protein n=1 Tax=Cucumis melo var. makuwa TaxID=1194695 RepID=A0A5A7VRG0_CUCMM|nr:pol protein [Cucumis melo var. makuwa]
MTPFEVLFGRFCTSPVCWSAVDEQRLLGPELVQTTNKARQNIRARILTVQSRQKSYLDERRKDLEFDVGDLVFLKLPPLLRNRPSRVTYLRLFPSSPSGSSSTIVGRLHLHSSKPIRANLSVCKVRRVQALVFVIRRITPLYYYTSPIKPLLYRRIPSATRVVSLILADCLYQSSRTHVLHRESELSSQLPPLVGSREPPSP